MHAMANSGNLAQVRERLQELRPGDIVGYGDTDALNAQMEADLTPAWYAIETAPSHERIAAAHLAGRRFGIWLPEQRFEPLMGYDAKTGRHFVEAGEKLPRLRLMFPRLVFVFLWLSDRNYARAHAVPGVNKFLSYSSGKIVAFDDEVISQLRSLEGILCPFEIPDDFMGKKKRKRSGWRAARQEAKEREEGEFKVIATVKGWVNVGEQWIDTIEALRVLDGRDTNQALAKALGLAS